MFSPTDSKQPYDALNKLISTLEGHKQLLESNIRTQTQIFINSEYNNSTEESPIQIVKNLINDLEKTLFLIGLVKCLGKSYQTGSKDDQTYYQKSKPLFFNTKIKTSEDMKTQAALDEILNLTKENTSHNELSPLISSLHSRIEKGTEEKLKDLTSFYHRNYYIFQTLYALSVILMLSSIAIVFSSVSGGFAALVIGGVCGFVFNMQASYYKGTYNQLKVAADTTQKLVNLDDLRKHAQTSEEQENKATQLFDSFTPLQKHRLR